jgi:glyoxylase-like metal-dependent hydrolase (beta-lactamase superfamily II)
VNVYAVRTGDGVVLVDGGWALPVARDTLVDGLEAIGALLTDVRRFLVTHVHRDHYTQAVVLRRETGADVALGAGEKPTLDLLHSADRDPLGGQVAQLRRLGAPEDADALAEAMRGHQPDLSVWEPPDTWLHPGDITLAGGRVLEAVSTPGHTRGHLVFHDLDAGLLFAGDHVLPTITPSIGFEPVLSPDPLGAFLRSLALVRSRPDARLLPAHGPVTESVHARVDELVAHHGRRLDEVLAASAGRGTTAADVAGALRWTRHERRLEDLDLFNRMLAVFETAAHLDLLVAQGRLRLDDADGMLRYT